MRLSRCLHRPPAKFIATFVIPKRPISPFWIIQVFTQTNHTLDESFAKHFRVGQVFFHHFFCHQKYHVYLILQKQLTSGRTKMALENLIFNDFIVITSLLPILQQLLQNFETSTGCCWCRGLGSKAFQIISPNPRWAAISLLDQKCKRIIPWK